MKTYYSNEEASKDIVNGALSINDNIEIAFDGFSIGANINCHNIYSKDYARDITARSITAMSINASDINYYAVCFAYNNIVCKSIAGRRVNAKHFCLDGKITIKDEAKKKVMLDLTDEQLSEIEKIIGK